MKKALGITIGVIGVALATVQFVKTYEAGDPNWQYPILAFGMCFILYYTLLVPKEEEEVTLLSLTRHSRARAGGLRK